jgi:thiamine biosynthesis lipoprotein
MVVMPGIEARLAGSSLSRRRFVSIAGAVAGAALLPGSAGAVMPLHRWQGTALGADARLLLAHPDGAVADRLIDRCVSEVRRLERIFSLYDPASSLSQLNRAGYLEQPPFELVELLATARSVSAATAGAFDATVQPLWARFAEHFAQADGDFTGPDVSDVLPLVDWRAVRVGADRIGFARPGMAVTLNGIAQGFITDAVTALLRREGIARVLVDLGEIRAVGQHPAGRPWRAGIDDPAAPGTLLARIELSDRALATSGGYGTVFDADGRFGHLIDPRNGQTAPVARSISVLAANATTADALSTAFSVMDDGEIAAQLSRWEGTRVYVCDRSGFRAFPS